MISWIKAFFRTAFSAQFIKPTIVIIFILLLVIYASFTPNDKDKIVTSQPSPTIKHISPYEHLMLAKKYLNDGYAPNKDPMKTKWGNVAEAKKHIEGIKPTDNEYQQSLQLKNEVERREKEIKKLAHKVAKRIMITQRESYAENIEKIFLSNGMDVSVSTIGPEKTVLKLDYILWSRPLIYKFVNENNFLDGPKKAGFKKVIFYDTHNYRWTYDLD